VERQLCREVIFHSIVGRKESRGYARQMRIASRYAQVRSSAHYIVRISCRRRNNKFNGRTITRSHPRASLAFARTFAPCARGRSARAIIAAISVRESGISFARHYVGPFAALKSPEEGRKVVAHSSWQIEPLRSANRSRATHLDNSRPIRSEAVIGTSGAAFLKDE
jgi:hypothetical protein